MRIHFTLADLRRTTVAAAPSPLFETVISVRQLQGRSGVRRVAGWRRTVRAQRPPAVRELTELIRPAGNLPDFLIQPPGGDFTDGVSALLDTPTERIAADLAEVLPGRLASGWVRDLAAGSPAARRALGERLHGYHAHAVAPHWPGVRGAILADRAMRAEMLLRGGMDALLSTLDPTWHWRPPVLYVPLPGDYDVPLCGNGLVLTPSYFTTGAAFRHRPDGPSELTYPVRQVDTASDGAGEALGTLLGRTRAGVLAALRAPATTTGLADRLNISLASASQHAAVLRNNGLVSTTRVGGAVLHAVTPLGSALLRGEG